MSWTITDTDSFYLTISNSIGVGVNIRKDTVEIGDIDTDELTIYADRRPRDKGSMSFVLDYTVTTVAGESPSSASELQEMIERLLLSKSRVRRMYYTAYGYEILPTDDIVVCTSGLSLTMHSAVGYEGVEHTIKSDTEDEVDLTPSGGELIDGDTEIFLTEYESITIVSDGSDWLII